MIDLRTRTYLASALLGMSLLALRAPAAADNIQLISLQTGHSVSVAAPGLTRVAVGDGRIAGVVPIGTQALVINGKSPGHTTVFVWSGANRMTYEVTVTEQSIDDIARILRAAINDPGVQIVAFNQNLIAEGTVPDIAAFNNLNDVLARFKGLKFTSNGGGNGVIVNAVTIRQPLGSLQSEIASLPGGKDLRVDVDQKGNVIVSGAVRTDAEAQEVLDKVNGLAGPYLGADGKVVDRLGITEASQVDVKVYVLEVDHTAQSQLGLHLNTAFPTNINGPGGGGTYTISSQPSIVGLEDPLPASGVGGLLKVGPFSRLSLLAPSVDLLLTEGHARILSSPDLVTEPGEQADFLVGGQIPIPVSNGLGTVSMTYKDYGVKLQLTPTILGNGSIETKINPEISELDFANGININGFTIPALKTSRISTDIITENGESVVMGGLLQRVTSANIEKIPLLGDLPIIGRLFRSEGYQHTNTDVVFLMTPTIITK